MKDTGFSPKKTKFHRIAPTTKEKGKLSINDPVTKHLPKFKGVQKNKITIKQLLTHTSGLPPVLPLKPEWKGYEQAINLCYSAEIRNTPGTVSYTHLTLPTIYSV